MVISTLRRNYTSLLNLNLWPINDNLRPYLSLKESSIRTENPTRIYWPILKGSRWSRRSNDGLKSWILKIFLRTNCIFHKNLWLECHGSMRISLRKPNLILVENLGFSMRGCNNNNKNLERFFCLAIHPRQWCLQVWSGRKWVRLREKWINGCLYRKNWMNEFFPLAGSLAEGIYDLTFKWKIK